MDKPIILQDDEYCHVLNNDNGTIQLHEGPLRITLYPNQSLFGNKKRKVIVKENEWVVVLNPFDPKTGLIQMGKREVRKGPILFALYPGEQLEQEVQPAHILNSNEAAIIQAIEDHSDRKAGEKWIIKGPHMFIPNKFETVLETVKAINVPQQNAIYVRNTRTSELKLVEGPISYLLNVDEALYNKRLREEEYKALGIPSSPSHFAFVIQVQKNECVCVLDFQSNTEEYVLGPQTVFLGPHQGIKVLSLSAGVPKKEDQISAARIRLGPDFMNDMFTIRTKDNALLKLSLTYKWKFIVDEGNLEKVFASDFVGYSCQSMRSRIREEAAGHNFEDFHTASAQILRSKLFKEYNIKNSKQEERSLTGRYFPEFSFLIFELDVREVTPVDEEIASLLNESIKSNMKTLCTKLENSAKLQEEKERIESQVEISKLRKSLIEIENSNFYKQTIEKAKVEGQALIEQAKAEKEAQEMTTKGKDELYLAEARRMIELLESEEGNAYLEYIKASNLHKNVSQACVVPSDLKTLFLPPMSSEVLAQEYEE